MPRPKRYGSDAEKMKAYRERKKDLRRDAESTVCPGPPERENDRPTVPDEVGEIPTPATNLPVPVLAEPQQADSLTQKRRQDEGGEARESTVSGQKPNSCGGQNLSRWDQNKDEERPGWYIFGTTERETNCWRCGRKYTTKLELSKFCSSKCKTAYLDSASHLRS